MSAPGQSGCTPIGHTKYDLTGVFSPNPITQFRPNEDLLINGTSRNHMFYDGYVVSWIATDSIGNVSIWSAGYGTNTSTMNAVMNKTLVRDCSRTLATLTRKMCNANLASALAAEKR